MKKARRPFFFPFSPLLSFSSRRRGQLTLIMRDITRVNTPTNERAEKRGERKEEEEEEEEGKNRTKMGQKGRKRERGRRVGPFEEN